MFNQYFGYYLLKKDLLTPEQLSEVFTLERSVRPKLGVLAIDAGLMTVKQVEEVHGLQHRMDKKFGEIAISQGYLSSRQLEELLEAQKASRLSLSQVIIDKEFLSLTELAEALEGYKRESRLTPTLLTAMQNADSEAVAQAFTDFSAAGADAGLLHSYVALTLRNILRFVGEEPVIDPSAPPIAGWQISQEMTGPVAVASCLVLNAKVLIHLASRYSGENLVEVDELAKDSIAEFLNENNGIFCVNLSDKGLEAELQPPKIAEPKTAPADYFRIPLRFTFGQVDLYINIKQR